MLYGFDLEIYKEVLEDAALQDALPLGITCIGLASETGALQTFYPGFLSSLPVPGYLDRWMDEMELFFVLDALLSLQRSGHQICTWNGLAFDFRVFQAELATPVMRQKVAELAMNHYDLMYQFLCERGFRIGLQAASEGMGLHGKIKELGGKPFSGKDAPSLWKVSPEMRAGIIQYVGQDALATVQLSKVIQDKQEVSWITRKGQRKTQLIRKLLPVKECNKLPLPDTSWMDKPIDRKDSYAWALQEQGTSEPLQSN